ncbi:MAG: ABC transporter ATP-binding protein, partial [Proteobacteria bacterium]|nr:ABC transporter ATP-binding protein [Pseudomonadota bacterium]
QVALFGKTLLDPEVLRMLLLSLAMILMMLLRPAGLIPARARYSHDHHLSNKLKQEAAK